jgi:murein DD-endopeptidase MepM/ murein hydrolase activator NlpD
MKKNKKICVNRHHLQIKVFLLVLIVSVSGIVPPAQAAFSAQADLWAGWHLPVPAGAWVISQGPCAAAMTRTHPCDFYEDRCAIDLDAPDAHGMENVPVLAPADGRISFVGHRPEAGITLMVLHLDGRVSVFMHLAQAVVALDQPVRQGEVIAYAGGTGDTIPHLHFFVQPNPVERTCLDLTGLDTLDYVHTVAISGNARWDELNLPAPQTAVPTWLPQLGFGAGIAVIRPAQVTVAPGAGVTFPVALPAAWLTNGEVSFNGRPVTASARRNNYALFNLAWQAPTLPGEYRRAMRVRVGQAWIARAWLTFVVRPTPAVLGSAGVLEGAPTFVSPPNWLDTAQPVQLCWRIENLNTESALTYRVWIAGPNGVTVSEWLTEPGWQAPPLPAGDYFWKVQVRDARGWLNRPTQRPWVFRVK